MSFCRLAEGRQRSPKELLQIYRGQQRPPNEFLQISRRASALKNDAPHPCKGIYNCHVEKNNNASSEYPAELAFFYFTMTVWPFMRYCPVLSPIRC